jgi:hypothetical protein
MLQQHVQVGVVLWVGRQILIKSSINKSGTKTFMERIED